MSNAKMTWQIFKEQLQNYPEQVSQFQYAEDKLVAPSYGKSGYLSQPDATQCKATDRGTACGAPVTKTLEIPVGMAAGESCTPGGGCC